MSISKWCCAVALVVLAFSSGCSEDQPYKTEIDPAIAKSIPTTPPPSRDIPSSGKGARKSNDHVGDLSPIIPPH
jgi:hypothetical protein